jgi:hypothetical protein
LKRRSEERASHRQSLLPKMRMMKALTQTGRILEKMVATTAVVAATLKKILNMRKVLQRLTSPAEIAETLSLCGDLYNYVNSWGCDI